MAMKVRPGTGSDVPSMLWVVVARLAVLAVVVALIHLGLREAHGPMFAALIVGAAWFLGRVD